MDNSIFNPNLYLERLDQSIRESVPYPLALIVSFPSNSMAQITSLDFYRQIVKIALKYQTYILLDLAYAEIYYDGNKPPSILEVPRAKEIAVQFTSMSKTYAMAVWRIVIVVGNKKLINALTRIKSYLDYGAATALNGSLDFIVSIRNIYQKKRDVLIESISRVG